MLGTLNDESHHRCRNPWPPPARWPHRRRRYAQKSQKFGESGPSCGSNSPDRRLFCVGGSPVAGGTPIQLAGDPTTARQHLASHSFQMVSVAICIARLRRYDAMGTGMKKPRFIRQLTPAICLPVPVTNAVLPPPLVASILLVAELALSLPLRVWIMPPVRRLDSDTRRRRCNSRCLYHHLGVNRNHSGQAANSQGHTGC
jgi:hypothetical protein